MLKCHAVKVLYDTLWHLDLTGLDMMLSPAKLSQGSDTDH